MALSQKYHHGDLRNAAVGAAIDALDNEGVQLPSLRELARRCGVSHTALYRHFDGQDDLRALIAADTLIRLHEVVMASVAEVEEPFARLRTGYRAWMRWAADHPHRVALLMGPEMANQQSHQEFFDAAKLAFGAAVEAVMACGVPHPILVAHGYAMAIAGFAEMHRNGRTVPGATMTVDEQIEQVCAMIEAHARAAASQAKT